MPAMNIKIPNGFRKDDAEGTIECFPDSEGNWLYIETDEGPMGVSYEPPDRPAPPVGALVTITILSPVGA